MFYNAALDINEKNGTPNRRFMSCVKFVADVVTPAAFYLNAEWSKLERLKALGIEHESLSEEQKRVLQEIDLLPVDSNSLEKPTLVYLKEGSWDAAPDLETSTRSGLVVPKREFVLSSSAVVHRAHLRDCGLNAQTAILCLAAVGLDILLPNVAFDLLADEEIERVKDELTEERHNYLEVVAKLASQSYEFLKDGDYNDVIRWAESEAAFKLAPKARVLEEAVASLAAKQLRQAGYSFWKDGVPTIGAAYVAGGLVPASAASAQTALKTLVQTIGKSRSERMLPEVAYAMKLSKALQK